MKVKIRQIAELIQAEIEGNPDEVVTHPDKIESAGAGAITFFSNPKYEKYLYTTQATAVIIGKDYQLSRPVPATLLRVENAYLALSTLFNFFEGQKTEPEGISDLAYLHESTEIGKDSYVGPFTVVEKGVKIGANSRIGSQVYIGPGVRIGHHVRIYPGVKIYHDCRIGNHVIVHSNAVIGSDGFGFVKNELGEYIKIPQIGHVEIGDHVEIGASTVIDRASMGKTIVHQGVKLDNLIQIGHNVVIGKNCVIAAQTGIAGSTSIGENTQIGGQVGTAGHIHIGANSKIAGQSGVMSDVEEGQDFFGSPAFNMGNYMRSYVVFRQLPELRKEIQQLKKQMEEFKKK